MIRPSLRRIGVGGQPVTSGTATTAAAHPLTGTHETGSAFEAGSAAPLGGLKRARAPALELTSADLSLPPGPQAISAKALFADAVELLKESGVSPIQAITAAGTRLGYPMAADMNSGVPMELFKAMGPVSLPLLSGVASSYAAEGLRAWKLDLNAVLPALVEQGRDAPDLYRDGLKALVANPHLTEPQVLAVQDALIRTELQGGRVQAPLLDGSANLDGLVANLRELAQGKTFGEALPVVSRLVRAGLPFDPGPMRALVDRALDSPEFTTRAQAAGLFWQSSVITEAGVKAYLKSLFERGRWSADARSAAIEHYETNPAWSNATAMNNLFEDATGIALAKLLEAAPANAEVLPAVTAAPWPWGNNNPKLGLVDTARAALWWSTLAPERVIPVADSLGERLTSNTFVETCWANC